LAPTTNEAKTVGWVIEQLVQAWRSGAKWSLDGQQHPHEASYLRLDHSKARSRLDWRPRWGIGQTIEKIVEWPKPTINVHICTKQSFPKLVAFKLIKKLKIKL